MAETASTPMDLPSSFPEQNDDDLSSRHTLPVLVEEDTLRPPSPSIPTTTTGPLTWWSESNVGERYNYIKSVFYIDDYT